MYWYICYYFAFCYTGSGSDETPGLYICRLVPLTLYTSWKWIMSVLALVSIMWGSNIYLCKVLVQFVSDNRVPCSRRHWSSCACGFFIYMLLSVGARSPYCVWPLLVWCPAGGYRLGVSGWHCILYTCCHTCYGICCFSACCWVRLVLDLINASDVQWKLQYLALDVMRKVLLTKND